MDWILNITTLKQLYLWKVLTLTSNGFQCLRINTDQYGFDFENVSDHSSVHTWGSRRPVLQGSWSQPQRIPWGPTICGLLVAPGPLLHAVCHVPPPLAIAIGSPSKHKVVFEFCLFLSVSGWTSMPRNAKKETQFTSSDLSMCQLLFPCHPHVLGWILITLYTAGTWDSGSLRLPR